MTEVNTSLNLTETDVVSDALSLKSRSGVLEKLPEDLLSSVDHSRQDQDPYDAESDSGDSLFLSQTPVPQAVRSRRHFRSKYQFDLTSHSGSDESEDEPSASSLQGKSKPCKRSWKKCHLPKFSFPFLSKIRDDKQQYQRRRNQNRLRSRKNTELHSFAVGGFFKCVRELQVGTVKEPTAFMDEDGDISPLSEGEDRSDLEDIRVVKKTAFVVSCKCPHPWYTPSTGDITDVTQEKQRRPERSGCVGEKTSLMRRQQSQTTPETRVSSTAEDSSEGSAPLKGQLRRKVTKVRDTRGDLKKTPHQKTGEDKLQRTTVDQEEERKKTTGIERGNHQDVAEEIEVFSNQEEVESLHSGASENNTLREEESSVEVSRTEKRGIREDEEVGEGSPPPDVGRGTLNKEYGAIKRKKKRKIKESLDITEETLNLSLDSLPKQSRASCEEPTMQRKKCKKSSRDDSAEALGEKEDEDLKHCNEDVALRVQAEKNKKKKVEESICQTSEDAAAQSVDSVSVQETGKRKAASVCAADAVEKDTQSHTWQEKAESVFALTGEKGVHTCYSEADSAEMKSNGKVKDKKKKKKRKTKKESKVEHGQTGKQAEMQEVQPQTSSLNTISSVSHQRKSKESSASLLNNTDEMVKTSERASPSSTDPAKVKKRADGVSPEETDPVRPEKRKRKRKRSSGHFPFHRHMLFSPHKVKKGKGGKGKMRLHNPNDVFMDI